ncbi:hypothetical protein ACWCQ1_21495 [Streptomyces sp. NPDC002144]
MTTTLDTTVPSTFRGRTPKPSDLAGLAEGAGMDLSTVYSLASQDNLVMAVRRYQQRKTETRTMSGQYAQRLLNLRAYDPGNAEMTNWQRQVHLHMRRREGW